MDMEIIPQAIFEFTIFTKNLYNDKLNKSAQNHQKI